MTNASCVTACRLTGGGYVCNDQGTCCDRVNGHCSTATCAEDTECAGTSVETSTGTYATPVCSSACLTDGTATAETIKATFGGQVGAPYVIGGCHIDDFGCIQGEWTHMRHKQRGSFHASQYNSMICSCLDINGNPVLPVGEICNPCKGPACHMGQCNSSTGPTGDYCDIDHPCPDGQSCVEGPEPAPAPDNVACFSGVGLWNPNKGRRQWNVAFRVEFEDRGEPGGGRNAGALDDVYRIRIWIPADHTYDSAVNIAKEIGCTIPIERIISTTNGHCSNCDPTACTSDAQCSSGGTCVFVGPATINDGGNLVHGNLQIHKLTGNPTNNDTCPTNGPTLP